MRRLVVLVVGAAPGGRAGRGRGRSAAMIAGSRRGPQPAALTPGQRAPGSSAAGTTHAAALASTPLPPAGPRPHLNSEVARSKVTSPSGRGYSRGAQAAAGRSRSWSAYLRAGARGGAQQRRRLGSSVGCVGLPAASTSAPSRPTTCWPPSCQRQRSSAAGASPAQLPCARACGGRSRARRRAARRCPGRSRPCRPTGPPPGQTTAGCCAP